MVMIITSHCAKIVTMTLNLGSKPAPGKLALVQGFVNTADLESGQDDLADPEALRAWLVRYGLLEPGAQVDAEEHREALELREAFRALLFSQHEARPDPDALAVVERLSTRSPLVVVFATDGTARLEPAASGIRGALGRLFAIAYTAVVDGTWSRLKACRNEGCRWAFYDHSKNRSGSWCTMEVCGSRLKARAYRRRRAAAS
jgi:predicted RNA-binding Zn ribbon-like protein